MPSSRRYEPRQVLDPADPYSIGAMVGPRGVRGGPLPGARPPARRRWAASRELGAEFAEAFGRDSGGLLHPYRSADAEVVVVAMGSVLGTIKDVVDTQRAAGRRIGAVGITSFRPFPIDAVRDALQNARQVVVVEKAFSVGFGGVLSTDVAMALSGLPIPVVDGRRGPGWPSNHEILARRRLRRGRTWRTRAPHLPRPQRWTSSSASSSAWPCTAAPGPRPRTCCATSALSPRGSAES